MEHRLMTEMEKVEIFRESYRLYQEGKDAEALAVHKRTPLPAYLAKIMKEKVGTEYLIQSGWNLAEAEAEFGPDWLNR